MFLRQITYWAGIGKPWPWGKSDSPLVSINKVWLGTSPLHSFTYRYGCFCSTMTELSSFKRDYTAYQNLKDYLELYMKVCYPPTTEEQGNSNHRVLKKAMQSEGKGSTQNFTQRKYLSHIKMK